MQASQSSNASNLLTPETVSDPAFPRGFPSPFSAPIQAARKYFERQRGDAAQTGARESGAPAGTAERGGESPSSNPGHPGQSSREQDRRLERSLYGHSIETALSFDSPQTAESLAAAGAGRAYFADSDGSEPLFPYAEAGPLPDPAAVRGAILRLARESGRRGLGASPASTESAARDAGANATEIELVEGASAGDRSASKAFAPERYAPEISERGTSERGITEQRISELGAEAGRPVPPLAFRDVARRVWGADYPQFLSGPSAEHNPPAANQRPLSQATASAAATAIPSAIPSAVPNAVPSAVPIEYGTRRHRPEETTRSAAVPGDAAADLTDAAGAARNGLSLSPAGLSPATSQASASSRQAVHEPAPERADEAPGAPVLSGSVLSDSVLSDSVLSDALPSDAVLSGSALSGAGPSEVAKAGPASSGPAAGVAQEEPALAHDACNLLSALALYSELLASPGVLGDRHRHYAEELKLMAGRSQVLIDRLLGVAAARKAEGRPFGGQPQAEQARTSAAAGVETVPAGQRDGAGAKAAAGGKLEDAAGITCGLAEVGPSATASEAGVQEVVADHAAAEAASAALPAERGDGGEIPLAAAAAETAPRAGAEEAPATSLVYLLMRWGSLLSTLAHGTLEVGFGPHAATPVPAGAEALERILVNLVRNARAATAVGGAIRIGVGVVDAGTAFTAGASALQADLPGAVAPAPRPLTRQRGTMALTVDDSGCGMSEAQVRRILGETEGPSQAAPPAEGHDAGRDRRQGLGLQIVRQLVAASGGTLSIQSWPGRGTRVEIRWPVEIQPAAEVPESIPESVPEAVPDRAARAHQAGAPAFETAAATAEVGGGTAVDSAPPAAAPLPADAVTAAALAEAPRPMVPAVGPVFEPFLQPSPAAAPAGSPSRSLAAARETVGPDGFSEAELRAMMQRMHRTGPQERSPLSRRLDRRLWDAKLAGGRPHDLGPRNRADGDHGLGVLRSTVPGFGVPLSSASVPGIDAAGWSHAAQNGLAHEDVPSKGAIAC
jgi:signal transduction histidine kinase